MNAVAPIAQTVPDALRGDLYALLASVLAQAPSAERLVQLSGLTAVARIPAPLAAPLNGLKAAAAGADPGAVSREYSDLFIGLGRGELVPYACWYTEKRLMGARLARLRADLAGLKIQRQPGVREPEDHVAALCEIMVLLIGRARSCRRRQTHFFQTHLAPWMSCFFEELQQAPSARFYRPVGDLGVRFMHLENQSLRVPAAQGKRPPARGLTQTDVQGV